MSRSWKTFLIVVGTVALTVVGALLLSWEAPHVQIAPEAIAVVGGFVVTNTMLSAYMATGVLVLMFWLATRRIEVVPGRLQSAAELIVETFIGLCSNVAGERNGRRFFSLVMTIFLFVLVANWMGLLPGFGTIRIQEPVSAVHTETEIELAPGADESHDPAAAEEEEHAMVPLFRGATTDLNTTLALALISVIATQVYGVRTLGAGQYASKFFNFRGGPIALFVGLLELIGEFSRIISFSFRLFGNIFAGEVLLAVVGFLVPLVATLPFLGLELFVGVVQAFIFAMLTLVFLTIAVLSHSEHHEESAGHGH